MAGSTASLRAYVITRVILIFPMLLLLLTFTFLILRVIPGDPITTIVREGTPQAVIDRLRAELGLNDPLYIQYFTYLRDVFTGNMGTSIVTQGPVTQEIAYRMPATIELALSSMFVASVLGIGLGTFSGTRRDSLPHIGTRLYGALAYNNPIFWFGLIMKLIFAVWLGWLPVSGRFSPRLSPPPTVTGLYTNDSLLAGGPRALLGSGAHLIFPGLALGILPSGFFPALTRVYLLPALGSLHAQSACARRLEG